MHVYFTCGNACARAYFSGSFTKEMHATGNFQLQNIPVHLKILSSRKLTHGNACEGILKLELSRRIQFKLSSITPSIYVIYDTL